MYKVILDTNVFLSAFVFSGLLPQRIIDLAINRKIQLNSSPALEKEVVRKLRKLGAGKEVLKKADELFQISAVFTASIEIHVCRDPKDNFLLELSETAKADYLITRDKDLLDLDDHL